MAAARETSLTPTKQTTGSLAVGMLASIWSYPVKSLRAQQHERIRVLADGLEGDRQGALFVTDKERPRAGNSLRGKEHNLLHTVDDTADAIDLARTRGWTVELHEGERYFDAEAVSLIVDLWVRDVEALVGHGALDPRRWRPNFFVAGAPDFTLREEDLVGRELRIGDVQLSVVSSIVRCVTPNYDIATGEADASVLREVVQQRNERVGIYCTVVVPGTVAQGDSVVVSG